MKRVLALWAFAVIALCPVFAQQNENEIITQPVHVVGRRINASGQITRTLEADFTYKEDGKFYEFDFPQYHLSSAFVYNDDYLSFTCTSHEAGYPSNMECLDYTYEEGRIKHITHEWDQMNAPENWEYSYDEYGRLKQKDYCEGYEVVYDEHYIYEYGDDGHTVTESYRVSWGGLKKRTIKHFDDNFVLATVLTENYTGGVLSNTTLETYTYTPSGDIDEQVTQTLTDNEWVNTSVQRYLYDDFGRVSERQNGSWSEENGDWNITKRITFEYEMREDSIIYTVSFYKKNGEEWVWDVFYNQTILFGSRFQNQQKCLRYYVYEDMVGSGQINQFEFTLSNLPEPIYLDTEEKESMACAIHPNPTTGLVTITGKDLKQAEVLNTLGQQVATTQGQGETLQIDIANLPSGVYFVRVTDEEGRVCLRKVVKE